MTKKDVLTETTEKATEKVTAYMGEQMALVEKCAALYQAQVEKAAKFWTDAAETALAEGRKAAKAWMDLGGKVAEDVRTACEANVKEATKLFTPAA